MRIVSLEEHFVSPGFLAGPGKAFIEQIRGRGARGAQIYQQLQDVGAQRIANMDAAGVDVQVLSLNSPGLEQAPPSEQLSLATEANDFVADAISKNPSRLAAMAVLPTATPEKAAHELQIRFGKSGFVGAVVNGHTRGRYLDDPFFRRFSKLPNPCASRFISTRLFRQSRSLRRPTEGSRRPYHLCSQPAAGAGTSKPPRI